MGQRLADLEPQWIEMKGRRVGFLFRSPTKPQFWQTCYFERLPRHVQWKLTAALVGEEQNSQVQGCNPECCWTPDAPPAEATFETMTVTPSINGEAGGLWHGWIRSGAIT